MAASDAMQRLFLPHRARPGTARTDRRTRRGRTPRSGAGSAPGRSVSSNTMMTPGAQRRLGGARALEGERHVELVRPHEHAGRAAEQDRLKRPPGGNAAGHLDHLPQRGAERHLVDARAGRRMPAQAEQPRARSTASVPIPAYAGPPIRRISSTLTRVSTLLMTVGLPNTPACTGNGGLLRGSPRKPSIELKIAVSSPQMYAPPPRRISMSNANAVPHDVVAQQTARPRRVDRCLQPLGGERVLAAHVDESLLAAGREGGDRHGLDQAERIALHDAPDP